MSIEDFLGSPSRTTCAHLVWILYSDKPALPLAHWMRSIHVTASFRVDKEAAGIRLLDNRYTTVTAHGPKIFSLRL